MKPDKGTDEGWIQTYTGRKFSLTNPSPDDVCIADIAHALSQQCRFAGHTKRFYSVAQHCCLVHSTVWTGGGNYDDRKWALLHDASEAYLCDITKPLKQLLPEYREIETKVMMVIAEHFGLAYEINDIVFKADAFALKLEMSSDRLFDPKIIHSGGFSIVSYPEINVPLYSEMVFLTQCCKEGIKGSEPALIEFSAKLADEKLSAI